MQRGHKPGKHGKPGMENSGNLKTYQNLTGNSGKFEFLWKNLENSGKM